LCGCGKENFTHLATCKKITPLWTRFSRLANLTFHDDNDKLCTLLLGVRASGASLPPAHGDLFLILWKFIIINFTLAELERKPFDCDSIWKSVTNRYLSKANTLTFRVGMKTLTAAARGRQLDIRHENSLLHPLGSIDTEGTIVWAEAFKDECPPCPDG
jgi:hypothetical protein